VDSILSSKRKISIYSFRRIRCDFYNHDCFFITTPREIYMLTLKLLPAAYVIWQLPSNAPTPPIDASALTVVIRTADELSGVCEAAHAPAGAVINDGWRCLQFVGPFDLSLPGIMAQVATPLAQAGVPIFTLATYNTDYLLVPNARLADACNAIQQAGHVMSVLS
jgi:hypothetical protein